MPNHMAPNRLESPRRDEFGSGSSSPKGRAHPRRRVPDYSVSEQPPGQYPPQLDDEYGPPGDPYAHLPASDGDGPPSSLRLDRGAYHRPPLETPLPRAVYSQAPAPRSRVQTGTVPPPTTLPEEYDYPAETSEPARNDGDSNQVRPYRPDIEPDAAPRHMAYANAAPQQNQGRSSTRPAYEDDLSAGEPAAMPPYRELRDQLMRTIQLYSDVWKLGGIRTSENKLVAYLTPRSKNLDLKDAIHRREVLVIIVDSLGNTDVKEPRRPGLLRRLTSWITGG